MMASTPSKSKLSIEQVSQLRHQSKTERPFEYFTSHLVFLVGSVFMAMVLAFLIDAKLGGDHERDLRKVLSLVVCLSGLFVLTLSKQFEHIYHTYYATPISATTPTTTPLNPASSLTPKQLRLFGVSPTDLDSRGVEAILRPPPSSSSSNSSTMVASKSTPALERSSSSSSTTTTTTTPLRVRSLVQEDASKYGSPLSPLVSLPSTTATPSAVSTTTTTATMRPELTAALVVAEPTTPLHDEALADQIVESLEKENATFRMEQKVTNLKSSLFSYITQEILRPLEAIHDKLSHCKSENSVTPWFSIEILEWVVTRDLAEMHANQVEFLSLSDRQELRSLIRRRKVLGRFLEVRRNHVLFPKHYVLQRLRALTKSGNELKSFNWSGGGSDFDSNIHPTDAEILFHIMCIRLDTCLQQESVGMMSENIEESETSFLSIHVKNAKQGEVLPMGWWGLLNAAQEKPSNSTSFPWSSSSTATSSLSTKFYCPHWKVVVNGTVWEVCFGRNNLFHALVLFLVSLRKNYAPASTTSRMQDLLKQVLGT